ncbi:MAG: DHH family phosphoesterase [Synergistes sp.]|nr:DHH family phosphoesterase [Synergistes sp.]
MLTLCSKDRFNIYSKSIRTDNISCKFGCSPLQALLLEMRGVTEDTPASEVKDWLLPNMSKLLADVDLGSGSQAARNYILGLDRSSNVIVYGDYDVDGICSTAIAVELVMSRGARVRYYIPHRFNQGYGVHGEIAKMIAKQKCNLVIIVDCGTHDAESIEILRKSGIPVVIFDHHLVEGVSAQCEALVNPQVDGDANAKRLCATGVLWTWIWKNSLLPTKNIIGLLDLVALATIADCVSLASHLNRVLVREGIKSLRAGTHKGLSNLMMQLGIEYTAVNTDDLAMKVIPCLNAAGRLYIADLAVSILFPCKDVGANVEKLIQLNLKRRELSAKILEQVEKSDETGYKFVRMDRQWSAGVLSSVASRICVANNAPIALVASMGDVMRGTLRMPKGGDAVGVLKELDPYLNTWGGHRLAAGFSVKTENWQKLRDVMEEKLSCVNVEEDKEDMILWKPSALDMDTWSEAELLGPFGMENPSPAMYLPYSGIKRVLPLGKNGKHVKVETSEGELLAFGGAELFNDRHEIEGFVYKPKVDVWKNVTSLRFILEKMVVREFC